VECRKPYEAPPALVEQLSLRRFVPEGPLMLAAAGGCAACERTGYHGRTVIAEVLVLSDSVRRAVLERADGKTLERIATHEGMRTMKDDGLRKALHGVTTIEEVTRVTNG
jgi:general secretion pathway protein E